MPTQSVTIEIEVPEGYEATGEYRSVGRDEYYVDAYCSVQRGDTRAPWPILRRKPDPVALWLTSYSWIPDGCWVFRRRDHTGFPDWHVSRCKPSLDAWEFGTGVPSIRLMDLAHLNNANWTEPPANLLQVTRPAAQGGEA